MHQECRNALPVTQVQQTKHAHIRSIINNAQYNQDNNQDIYELDREERLAKLERTVTADPWQERVKATPKEEREAR